MAKNAENHLSAVEDTVEAVDALEVAPECCGKDECTDCPYDSEDSPVLVQETVDTVELAEPVPHPNTVGHYSTLDGETYAVVADKFPVAGLSKHERATHLYLINGGKTLTEGTLVKL